MESVSMCTCVCVWGKEIPLMLPLVQRAAKTFTKVHPVHIQCFTKGSHNIYIRAYSVLNVCLHAENWKLSQRNKRIHSIAHMFYNDLIFFSVVKKTRDESNKKISPPAQQQPNTSD